MTGAFTIVDLDVVVEAYTLDGSASFSWSLSNASDPVAAGLKVALNISSDGTLVRSLDASTSSPLDTTGLDPGNVYRWVPGRNENLFPFGSCEE